MPTRKAKKKDVVNALVGAIRLLRTARYDALQRKPGEEELFIPHEATETEQVFRPDGRVKSYVQAEQLADNNPVGATVETFVRLAIGRRGGAPQFLGERMLGHQAYWDEWKKHCGWESGECWQDVLSLILYTVKTQGDCLVWCDPYFTEGKVRVFAPDMVCSIDEMDWKEYAEERGWYENLESGREYWRQVEGVVIDLDGRVRGYWVTSMRNMPRVPRKRAMFLPAESARLVFKRKKCTQYRGESALLPNRDLTKNTGSLISSEVQAARNAAETAVIIEEAEGAGASGISALLNGLNVEQATEGTDLSPQELAAAIAPRDNRMFEALSGRSAISTVPHGTGVHTLDNGQRPSHQIQEWMKELDEQNGNRLGVKSIISRSNTAGTSYSSGELELVLSWQGIESAQMMLERQVIDYVLDVILPDAEYTVYWPEAFSVDPEKAEKVKDAQLRGGRVTYREILGPYWRDKFEQLSEEMKVAKELGIFDYLSSTQTSSGAKIETNEDGKGEV